MKMAYKTALLVMGFGISAFAADLSPKDQNGNTTIPNYAGSKTCVIDVSTATSAVLCTTGSGIVLQIIPSTTTSDVLVFRDSNTANTSSAKLMAIGGAAAATVSLYPKFINGLSANLLTQGGIWTIIYAQPK